MQLPGGTRRPRSEPRLDWVTWFMNGVRRVSRFSPSGLPRAWPKQLWSALSRTYGSLPWQPGASFLSSFHIWEASLIAPCDVAFYLTRDVDDIKERFASLASCGFP